MLMFAAETAACSSPSASNRPSAASACADWATQYCERLNACDPYLLNTDFGAVGLCAARNQAVCESALTATGTGATVASIENCAGLYAVASCDVILSNQRPAGCVVPGSLAAGSACGDDSQCSGTNPHCHIPVGMVCGTCSILAPSGGTCATDADCMDGLVCGAGVCVKPGTVGSTCDGATMACPESLLCEQTCLKPLEVGANCDPAANLCDGAQGLYCDSQTGRCASHSYAAANASCGGNSLCAGGTCTGAAPTQLCVAPLADGAMCGGAASGPSCASPAICLNGTCLLPNASQCH